MGDRCRGPSPATPGTQSQEECLCGGQSPDGPQGALPHMHVLVAVALLVWPTERGRSDSVTLAHKRRVPLSWSVSGVALSGRQAATTM